MKERLRALRLEQSLTQKELASKINSTDKNIWAYENGIATPPSEIIVAYADFFGVSTDYLLGRTDDFGNVTISPSTLSENEETLLQYFRALNAELQGVAIDTVRALAGVPANGLQKRV